MHLKIKSIEFLSLRFQAYIGVHVRLHTDMHRMHFPSFSTVPAITHAKVARRHDLSVSHSQIAFQNKTDMRTCTLRQWAQPNERKTERRKVEFKIKQAHTLHSLQSHNSSEIDCNKCCRCFIVSIKRNNVLDH